MVSTAPDRRADGLLAETIVPPFDTLRTVLDVWCCPSATEAEIEIAECFKSLDKDNSGFITIADFRGIGAIIGHKFSDAEMDDMLAEADVQSDGRINYMEFVKKIISM